MRVGLVLFVVRLVGVLLLLLVAGDRFSTAAEPTDGVQVANDEGERETERDLNEKRDTPPTVIHVGIPRTNEHIWIDGPAKLYEPAGLEALETYEFRVSFVSTRAAQIHLGLLGAEPTKMSRRLLHAEKLVFSTDEFGRVRGVGAGCQLELSVTSWGRVRGGADRDFFYDVVLERNVMGVPVSGIPLLAYALFVVCAIFVWGGCGRVSDLLGVFNFFFPAERSKHGAGRKR
jgi:hypothetical protein